MALTGASGIVYGRRLVEVLHEKNMLEAVIYTDAAVKVARYEESIELISWLNSLGVVSYSEHEIDSPYASSSRIRGPMVVAPCSTKTLALIAHGIPGNLVARAALATLRLGRKLVLLVRETPLGVAELRNMLLAAENGAIIMPAAPAFYHKPSTVMDLVDFMVGKILDALNMPHNLYRRWRSV